MREAFAAARFAAAQAAQKVENSREAVNKWFAAAQAAQKNAEKHLADILPFAAAQAAQKMTNPIIALSLRVRCRAGSSEMING